MGLYDLTDFELVWERAMDTKCLLAWNPQTHVGVISFRGTASMANVLADLQARLMRRLRAASLHAAHVGRRNLACARVKIDASNRSNTMS